MKWKGKELEFHVCHQLPERSFFWKGQQFPVCARCTGFYSAYITGIFFLLKIMAVSVGWSFLLFIPAIVDGSFQAATKYKSNNWLRLATGTMAGVGFMSLTAHLGAWIGEGLLFFF